MTKETVVLVHGLWMNGLDMSLLHYQIQKSGYAVTYFRYRSLAYTPRENAARLQEKVKKIDTPIIHFVCHSLGGLIVRYLFSDYPGQKPGKVVTLGTPHKPSHTAYRLSRLPFGTVLLGKSIDNGLLGKVPKWDGSHDLGSIAGKLRIGLGMFISKVPLPNDGTVAVEETKVDTMKDHVIINSSHFGLLLSPQCAHLCVEFLTNGVFKSI
jgi:pimeloyl-ACP methyl ester carboxylesterase